MTGLCSLLLFVTIVDVALEYSIYNDVIDMALRKSCTEKGSPCVFSKPCCHGSSCIKSYCIEDPPPCGKEGVECNYYRGCCEGLTCHKYVCTSLSARLASSFTLIQLSLLLTLLFTTGVSVNLVSA